jgi:hypothetical protein
MGFTFSLGGSGVACLGGRKESILGNATLGSSIFLGRVGGGLTLGGSGALTTGGGGPSDGGLGTTGGNVVDDDDDDDP